MSEDAIPKKGPYVQEVEPGKYAWCACGKSANQPLCDGSHRGTDISPVVTEIDEKQVVAWCGCKESKNKPFCDGSHSHI